MVWKKRIAGLALAMSLVLLTFAGSPLPAKAAPLATGIDVSQYQGAIDWTRVRNAGYTFAFVKIGSAKSGLDPYFAANMAGAQAAGLKVGAYVYSYASTIEGAVTEAQFAIAALEPFSVSMPVVYDLEDTIHESMTAEQVAALAVAFCSTVQMAGYYPMVYSGRNFAVEKFGGIPYEKWIAQYGPSCDYPGMAFWQFSSKGSVPGISGNVDLNYQWKDFSNLIVANGFVDRGGNRYYYRNYRMQFGFVEDGGQLYFMNVDGSLYRQGWLGDGVNLFYMDPGDGHMVHGLCRIDGRDYYFGPDGLMQRGLVALDGKVFYFAEDGAMFHGLLPDPATGLIRYFQEDGSMAVNVSLSVDGVEYVFDANGLGSAVPTAVPDPSAWITDPATGQTIDTVTGQIVDPAVVMQVLQSMQQG